MSYSLWTRRSWSETKADIAEMFTKWRVQSWAISCPSGRYNSANLSEEDREVTIAYEHPVHGLRELSYRRQLRPMDNLRVLYLALDSIRLNEARGIADIVREAYLSLPAPMRQRDPYEVLGVRPDAPRHVIEAAYRARARVVHPDAGGSDAEMAALNAAWEALR